MVLVRFLILISVFFAGYYVKNTEKVTRIALAKLVIETRNESPVKEVVIPTKEVIAVSEQKTVPEKKEEKKKDDNKPKYEVEPKDKLEEIDLCYEKVDEITEGWYKYYEAYTECAVDEYKYTDCEYLDGENKKLCNKEAEVEGKRLAKESANFRFGYDEASREARNKQYEEQEKQKLKDALKEAMGELGE